eukprot:gene11234-12413_t
MNEQMHYENSDFERSEQQSLSYSWENINDFEGDDERRTDNFEILQIKRGDDANEYNDSRSTSDSPRLDDEHLKQKEIFSNSFQTSDLIIRQNDDEDKLKDDYNELENDYEEYYTKMTLNDSLEERNFKNETPMHQEDIEFLNHSTVDNDNGIVDEGLFRGTKPSSKRKESCPVPKFRYKEPKPRFIEKNKLSAAKGRQSSYAQKFLQNGKVNALRKTQGENKAKKQSKTSNTDDHPRPEIQLLEESNTPFHGQSNVNSTMIPLTDLNFSNATKQIVVDPELSRLDEMIRREENDLKSTAFNLPQQEADVQYFGYFPSPYSKDDQHFHLDGKHLNIFPQEQGVFVYYPLSESSRKSDPNKRTSYAELHSVLPDKIPVEIDDGASSYAAQHLDKKSPHSYKKYSLREYRALSKDIKLQKSLGPDLASQEYLEKKARAEKKKEYASAVAVQNQQHSIKSRSAPALLTKAQRAKESKRAAALEYAKNVKSFVKKSASKPPVDQPRSSTDNGTELSALEIMKQRHEVEKKAIDEMRKGLATIIKDGKS